MIRVNQTIKMIPIEIMSVGLQNETVRIITV